MGSSPSNLAVTPVTDVLRVHATWDAPTTAYDGIRISMKQSDDAIWTVVYLDVPITDRYLYPVPGVAYDYRVEAVAGGAYSAPDDVTGIILPWWCDSWGLSLTDVASKVVVHLGLVENYSSLKRTRKSKVQSWTPMGAVFPKDWKSRAKYRAWPQLEFSVMPDDVLSSGTIVDNEVAVIEAIQDFFPPAMPLLQWRDTEGLETYVKILPDPDITPLLGGGWTITLNIEERDPPPFPVTSAT